MTKKEKRLIEIVRHKIGKTISTYNLIEEGDTVLVGLSGGKDSLILLETLSERRKYVPISYKLVAVHVNVLNIPYTVDRNYLESFCEKLNVEFIYKDAEYEHKEGKSHCFFCSWTRRKIFFELSKEMNIGKVATGHHLDDALETLFMNMVYHGSICSLPASFTMFDGRLQFIRPMIEIPESLLVEYASIQNFPKLKSVCPYDNSTKRKKMRSFIEQLQLENPQSRQNLFNSMSKIIPEYLPGKDHVKYDNKLHKDDDFMV